jgi:serine/threonine protein kinase
MRQLDHPNLMRVYEIYETKNSIYVLIEQLRGGSLADHAKSKAFSLDEVKVLMKGLLEGLTYLHAKRIMHRDIKPDNIMFRTEDVTQVVLADFGLATSLDVEEYIFTRCGSPGYVAPEVINLVNLKNKY